VAVLEGSPLHCAVPYNAMKCFELLLASGADPNIVDIQHHESPFVLAINTNQDAVAALLELKDVAATDIKNKEGETAFF
jgi:ankyrin repeat protein